MTNSLKSKTFAKSATAVLCSVSVALTLSACSQESAEERKLAAGLACIDSASTSADADVCISKVDGLSSPASYLIRCSANMIAQGFTGSRVANGIQKLKNSGEANPTASMLSYFVFAKNLANHTADITLSNCTASGVKSMIFLATMFQTATIAAKLGGGGSLEGTNLDPSSPTFNPAQLQQQFDSLYAANNPATNAAIGNLAITAQSTYCGSGSTLANQDVCGKLNSAVQSGVTAEDVGRALLNLLKPPAG